MYGIQLDPQGPQSRYLQLVTQLRGAVTSGQLTEGTRLASTRALAGALGLSRGLVVEAVDQLVLEGYLRTVPGSGTFVAPHLGAPLGPGPAGRRSDPPPDASEALLSFLPGVPDPELFPRRAWIEAYRQAVESGGPEDLGYNRAGGRLDLRQALARHLFETKGIDAPPGRILVTAGSAQALGLLAEVLAPGPFWVEDPQAPFLRRILEDRGAEVIDVEADAQGLRTDRLPDGPVRLIFTTPAHQFPLGGTLPADRRLALVRAAQSRGAWIVEDDFDSEFRYGPHPVAPLQVLDPDRVVYVGSFSKTLTPALRIGFVVLPPDLAARVRVLKSRWDLWNEGLQQQALARFLEGGHYHRHLRRALGDYRAKNLLVRRLVEDHLAGLWRVEGATTGTHLLLRREASGPPGSPLPRARPLVDALRRRGFQIEAVSAYARRNRAYDDALVLGFGARSEADLGALIRALAEVTVVKEPGPG